MGASGSRSTAKRAQHYPGRRRHRIRRAADHVHRSWASPGSTSPRIAATVTGDREHALSRRTTSRRVRDATDGDQPRRPDHGDERVSPRHPEGGSHRDRSRGDDHRSRGTINAIGLELDNKAKTVKFKSHRQRTAAAAEQAPDNRARAFRPAPGCRDHAHARRRGAADAGARRRKPTATSRSTIRPTPAT